MDFSEYFLKYNSLAVKVEEAFNKITESFPDLVLCKPGCTDCCYAIFDLTLVEAMHLRHQFDMAFTGEARHAIIEKANKADRQVYKLKKEAYKAAKEGKDEQEIVTEMAKERIRCPLLNHDDLCSIYPHRPLACRIYGVPLAIGGTGRTCGLSGFKKGSSYTTVNMDIIHDQLLAISAEITKSIRTKYTGLSEMLVPVSMALLTDYSEAYLGIVSRKSEAGTEPEEEQKNDNE